MSKESFKLFASSHPELVEHIKSGNMTWQKFYEIYDIYKEDPAAWSSYIKTSNNQKASINSFTDILKGMDSDSIQKHISTAQKAIGVVQELTGKSTGAAAAVAPLAKGPISPRPINKFFED